MKRHARIRHALIGLIAVVLAVVAIHVFDDGFNRSQAQIVSGDHAKSKSTVGHYRQERIPTFFFHGWNGSYKSEEQMTGAITQAGVTSTVIRADVDASGNVKFIGTIPNNAINPLIEVTFRDNKNENYQTGASWMRQVVVSAQSRYHFDQFNAVGHSMGNMVIMYYLVNYANDVSLPKLNKQVSIAGNFNGILGQDDEPNRMKLDSQGKPDSMNDLYRGLLNLSQTYPNGVDVLNIYGNVGDGSNSDGSLSNASSQSMRYLVSFRAKSYKEHMVTGQQGSTALSMRTRRSTSC